METVKILLENTKANLKMKLWWAEEHDKELAFIEEIPALKQEIIEIDKALLLLFGENPSSDEPHGCLDYSQGYRRCDIQCIKCKIIK